MTLRRPDLVVISQGDNFSAHRLANVCARAGLPYALIAQKAQEALWVPDSMLGSIRRAYDCAVWSYFVSRHNLRLTEEQLGQPLRPRASVVRNPFRAVWDAPLTWPEDDGVCRLACIGRLYPFDKGQDLLLRVLAAPKWKARRLSVTFYGEGAYRQGLEDMARHLGLTNVRFAGFASDIDAVWDTHHSLVLPSRGEGLPLVLVEAMLRGRVPIVTDVAGNAEVVSDDLTGFVAAAPTETALDEALERAWIRRREWRTMGEAAVASIRTLVPKNPEAVFADELLRVVEANPAGSPEAASSDVAPVGPRPAAPDGRGTP
jgi:glycosyltransferase involved in cell wall biosynthesis